MVALNLVYAAVPSFSINVEPVRTGKTGSQARASGTGNGWNRYGTAKTIITAAKPKVHFEFRNFFSKMPPIQEHGYEGDYGYDDADWDGGRPWGRQDGSCGAGLARRRGRR